MVQTLEPGTRNRPTSIIPTKDAARTRIPTPVMLPPSNKQQQRVTSRIPSPMPRGNSPMPSQSVINAHRMSRAGPNRTAAAPSRNVQQQQQQQRIVSAATPPGGVSQNDVMQQAQQYLEDNVKAWISPKNPGTTANMSGQVAPQRLEPTANNSFAQSSPFFNTPSGGIQANRLTTSNGTIEVHYTFTPDKPARHMTGNDVITSVHQPYTQARPPAGPASPVTSCPSSYDFPNMYNRNTSNSPSMRTFGPPRPLYDDRRQNFAGVHGPSAAASFFARAAQKLNLSASKKQKRRHYGSNHDLPTFPTPISDVIRLYPPPAPPALLRNLTRKDPGVGKVKVMLRIPAVAQNSESSSSFINIDGRKKQITIYDPSTCGFNSNHISGNGQQKTPMERRAGVTAPKMFAFDAIFSQDDSQTEVCCSALTDVIQAVVNGADGCLFCYGHGELGKTYTMIGSADSSQKLGIIPSAISWLFRVINEQKVKTGARFSVRMSAVEVVGKTEVLNDLLAEQAAGTENSGQSPGIYLLDDPILGTHLQNQSELRAPTAEKAAYYLDAALAARNQDTDGSKNSHIMVTLHVYQYRIDKSGKSAGVAGGRSRLHMFDLGSCCKQSKSETSSLSLSALGNVILAIFNGQKHVPYKESKLTQLLKEALSSITCRAAMIAHISTLPSQYSETLSTIQLAARIHRMRRKKMRFPMSSGPGESSCEERMKSGMRSATSSDPDATSSSEQSCDTVIYVGPNGAPLTDRELTDNEGPPISLPVLSKIAKPSITNSTKKLDKITEQSSASCKPADSKPGLFKTQERAVNKSGTTNSALNPYSNKIVEDSQRKEKPNIVSNVNSESSQIGRVHVPETASSTLNGKGKPSMPVSNASNVAGNVQNGAVHLPARKPSKHGHHNAQHSKSKAPAQKESRSDEQWVDGPRISKQKMESVGAILQKKGSERWVDGPASYGYMDDHKRNMIERWVELHSTHVLTNLRDDEKVNEIWIDKPNDGFGSQKETASKAVNNAESSSTPQVENQRQQSGVGVLEVKVMSHLPEVDATIQKIESMSAEASIMTKTLVNTSKKDTKHRLTSSRSTQSMSESEHLSEELERTSNKNSTRSGSIDGEEGKQGYVSSRASSNDVAVCVNDNSTSPMHQESTDDEEVIDDDDDDEDDDDYDDGEDPDVVESEYAGEVDCESFECFQTRGKVLMEYAPSEDDDHMVEIIEVEEPDEPVPMVDSCIQVNEEDIIACMILQGEGSVISENPLPEVDQESEDDHPLRALSDENLASSFTDSRSVSVDLENKSAIDRDNTDCESTCSSLSKQLILSSPSTIQRSLRSRGGGGKGCDDFGTALKSETFTEKLERIAKLRQCYQQQTDMKVYENINSGASTPTSTLSKHSLPTSRINLDDVFYKNRKIDDLESIYSEPANIQNLDLSTKPLSGLQPMNGLKLETFYSQMRRVPPPPPVLSDRPDLLKPTQIVSPLITNEESGFSSLDPSLFKNFDFEPSCCKSEPESPGFCQHQRYSEPASAALTPNKNEFISLRHPDGASDTNLNKHPSMKHMYEEVLTITTTTDATPQVELRSPGNGASSSDAEDRMRSNSESRIASMLRIVPGQSNTESDKKTKESTPSKFSKLSRFLGGRSGNSPSKTGCPSKNCISKSNNSSLKVNDSKSNSKFSPRLQLRNWGKNSSKLPSRSLPTSPPSETRKEIKTSINKHVCVESTSEQSIQSLTVSSNDKKHYKSPQSKLPTPTQKASKTATINTKNIQNGFEKTSLKKESTDKKSKSPSKQNTTKHSNQNTNQKNQAKSQSIGSNNEPEYDSGNDSGVVANHLLSSPYSRLTKPKVERLSSSGHGSSDNSSTLSGDHSGTPLLTPLHTPKVISRAPQPSGTSSGYESMIRDSEEGTGSSSNHDSASDSSGGGISRETGKNLRKKPQGFRNVEVLKTARKTAGIRRKSKSRLKGKDRLGLLYEYKILEEEHENAKEKLDSIKICTSRHDHTSTRKNILEIQRIKQKSLQVNKLREKQTLLKQELAASKALLMVHPSRWSYELHVEKAMRMDHPDFIKVLERETEILEKRVAACKSHITMVTCFDIKSPAS